MFRLVNPVKSYAWGSRSVIAELLGQPAPTAEPQAELWMGAHPSDPSWIVRDGSQESLAGVIEAAPAQLLGADVLTEFGPRLPFLLKVLAVEQPLSLQLHPDRDHAAAGFTDEQAREVAPDDPQRNYCDPHHKPEVICALTPFNALCGLRPMEQIEAMLAELAVPGLQLPAPVGLSELIEAILRADDPERLPATLNGCRRGVERGSNFALSYRCALDLAERYPGDPGVVVSLLLNLVRLRPGQAVYLPPGRLHAYMHGVGIEVMAASDNVLRGGLTSKHVDVPELLSLLDVHCGAPQILDPAPDGSGWAPYPTPSTDFALARAEVSGGSVSSDASGPEILLCTDGALEMSGSVPLTRGQSVFVPAGEAVDLTGGGTVYRATTGLG